jgi:hypothetical protein
MMEQDDASCGESYREAIAKDYSHIQYAAGDGAGDIGISQRPVYDLTPVLRGGSGFKPVRSPLDMQSGANMYAEGLIALRRGPIRRMIARLMGHGSSETQASTAMMQMIQGGHTKDRTM